VFSAGLAAVATTAALAKLLLVAVAGACAGADWPGAVAVSSCCGRYMGVTLHVSGHVDMWAFLSVRGRICVLQILCVYPF